MKNIKIRSGMTLPGATEWQQYEGEMPGIYVNVDTRVAKFKRTPHYVASLVGRTNHWLTTAGSCIYNPMPTVFRIYVGYADSSIANMTPSFANDAEWRISRIGIEGEGGRLHVHEE